MTSDSMSPADIAAVTGNRMNSGFGYDGGGLWWIIILFLFGMFNGGWGGNNMGGNGMNGLYPWMNQSNQMNDGFRDQMMNTQINGIQNSITSGFGDIQTALCGGFAGVNASIANAQMNDMQNMNALQAQLAQCCCDNRLATCQTQNIVQTEGASTRLAIQNQTQAILDKLCQLELDGYKRENDNLRSQLNMATLRESQTAQNAFIAQGLNNEVDQLYNRLNSCPVPTTPVYGRTPIFSCNNQNQGCGCGCGGVA